MENIKIRKAEWVMKAAFEKVPVEDKIKAFMEYYNITDQLSTYSLYIDAHKMAIIEIDTYDKFPHELRQTKMHCLNGDDGFLIYSFQCQECGTIILDNHGSEISVDYDLLCPTCNNIEKNYPRTFYKRGLNINWIMEMKIADWKGAKFQVTCLMEVYLYLYNMFTKRKI